jgi:small-conductance mechanosensitive channel
MFSPAKKALAAMLGAVIFSIALYELTSYSIIPSIGTQVEQSIFATLVGIVLYYVLSALASRIEESKLHFAFKRVAFVASVAVVVIGLLAVWIQQLTFLAISLGLVAAGISFSMQQPILSLVGWLVLAFERPFSVGERIEIKDVAGDVIDYGFFFVRVMEIRQWTDADLYTGRVLLIPTNWILSNTIYNYSKDFGYIWDKLWIGLLYEENYTKIANDIKGIALSHTQSDVNQASQAYAQIRSKHFLRESSFEPQVFVSFNSNWVQIDLRYIVEIRRRAITRSELSAMILNYLRENGVTVASSSLNVSVTEKGQ